MNFKPHTFSPKVELFQDLRVVIAPEALEWMLQLVDQSPKEVAWFGTAFHLGDRIEVREVFLPEQVVGPVHVDINTSGLEKLALDLISVGRDEDIEDIRLHGHSHVHMNTGGSGTDEESMFKMAKRTSWCLRVIANKSGRLEFTYVDTHDGVIIRDLPWEVLTPKVDVKDEVARQIREKVTEEKPLPFYDTKGNGSSLGLIKSLKGLQNITAADLKDFYTCNNCNEEIDDCKCPDGVWDKYNWREDF